MSQEVPDRMSDLRKGARAAFYLACRYDPRPAARFDECDWSNHPFFDRLGRARIGKAASEDLRKECRRLVEWVLAQPDARDDRRSSVRPWVYEWARLVLAKGSTTEALRELQAEGAPGSDSSYRREFLATVANRLLKYAAKEDPFAPAPAPKSRDSWLHRPRRVGIARPTVAAAAIVTLLAGAAWIVAEGVRETEALHHFEGIPKEYLGQTLFTPGNESSGQWHLAAVLPDLRLPFFGSSRIKSVCIVRRPERSDLIALGTYFGGDCPAMVALWDPFTDEILWERNWQPPIEQTELHKDLDDPSLSYGVMRVFHGSVHGNTENVLSAVFIQRYSGSFLTFWDLDTGTLLGSYANPGTIEELDAVDFDGDGTVEIAAAGVDNTRCMKDSHQGRAALAIIDPWSTDGATATVDWNNFGEEALVRLLFPDTPECRDLIMAAGKPNMPRLHSFSLDPESWNPIERTYTLQVGRRPYESCYYAKLGIRSLEDIVVELLPAASVGWESVVDSPGHSLAGLNSQVECFWRGDKIQRISRYWF